MAIHTDHQQQTQSFEFDALYCEEEDEQWEGGNVGEVEELERQDNSNNTGTRSDSLFPLHLLEEDLFWEDEELSSLFSKEEKSQFYSDSVETEDPSLCFARREAVEWILKVNAHYGFTVLTATLAINYLDRFLSSIHFQRDKPWMIQLAAVTCLSLAAKVEETQVPLLLDLQVEDSKYVFEAKTIQRMELLVLSTLEWRMNPVTPLSFLDHIVRRLLGLKTHLHLEFMKQCEALILSLISDSRFTRYLPSVLATATMLHVIPKFQPCNPIDYQIQLLGILKISKEKVNECYQLIVELSKTQSFDYRNKRRYRQIPSSQADVIDAMYSGESSNESWAVVGSSVSSSPELLLKKRRVHEQHIMILPSLNRVFVDVSSSNPL